MAADDRSADSAHVDAAFIDARRRQLLQLRETLRRGARAAEQDERGLIDTRQDAAPELEEEAQRLNLLDVDEDRIAYDRRRLAQVERALEKIEQGTYGRSDESGDPIPRARLEAMPEALTTVEEEEARERRPPLPGSTL